ncbi:MAG: hypothetical protein ACU841_13490 [Gammaproteobacteria bacterium]
MFCHRHLHKAALFIGFSAVALTGVPMAMAIEPLPNLNWSTVVNNGDYMPTDPPSGCNPEAPAVPPCRKFNSYNQPSVNANKTVVIRARSRGGQGGQQNVHGVYIRDMATNGPVQKLLDRRTLVPEPSNLDTLFVEPPSFPRIDSRSKTIATRGNHQPVWKYTLDGSETRAGTTGIYVNPYGDLITGASKLGAVPELAFFEVPERPGTFFDVFPGALAVTNGSTIVFKGNSTDEGVGKTGVYYRRLEDAPHGGSSPVILIANQTHTIPGTNKKFGSTAPPSAAGNKAVFTGLDNEEAPTAGGIYLAPLAPTRPGQQPKLKTLAAIGSQVPGEPAGATFNKLGEGLSFDGRFVAFWGAWGTQTRTVVLHCPTEGNRDRIEFCNEQHPDGFPVKVSVNQGIFVHDTAINKTFRVARTGGDFLDFDFWNFSGRAPGVGEGEEDGELARWRSSAFVAVSVKGTTYHVAFKARTTRSINGEPIDGIYLGTGKGTRQSPIQSLVETGMVGTILDTEAVDDSQQPLPVTETGIERDGFRNGNFVINASMGSEETGWAGV